MSGSISRKLHQVMLIDDSEVDLLLTRIVIERSGVADLVLGFEFARDALTHLRAADATQVDLILLDINMPGMNGFEFLQAYQELEQEQRAGAVIVMLTSSPNPIDRDRAFSFADVKGYINKPLSAAAAKELVQWLPP